MIKYKTISIFSIVFMCMSLLVPRASCQESSNDSEAMRPIEDKWALVIGIDRFSDKRIPTLSYSAKDAKDFADYLVQKGNFARDHIKLLLNEEATFQAIEESLGDTWLPRRALRNDLVLIFFSTHGSPREIDVGKDNWLIAHNTNVDKLYSTGIELRSLAGTVKKRTGCDRVVLILDACNSGAAETGGGKGIFRPANFDINNLVGEGEIVISSSDSNQRSWESKRYQNGVFTRKLIETLSGTGYSKPLNLVFEDLKSNVEQEVRFDRRSTQTPIFKSKWKGNPLILGLKPTKPRKDITPPVVQDDNPESNSDNQKNTIATSDTNPISPSVVLDRSDNSLSGNVEHNSLILSKQLAFMGVVPPPNYNIKMAATYGKVSQKDYDGIKHFPRILSDEVTNQLSKSLGNKLVEKDKTFTVLKAISTDNRSQNLPSIALIKNIATSLGAKNVAYIYTTDFSFKGQVSWSNVYNIKLLVKIYDGSSGRQKAEFKKSIKKQPWLGDSTSWWVDYVYNKIIPALSDDLAKEIQKNL